VCEMHVVSTQQLFHGWEGGALFTEYVRVRSLVPSDRLIVWYSRSDACGCALRALMVAMVDVVTWLQTRRAAVTQIRLGGNITEIARQ